MPCVAPYPTVVPCDKHHSDPLQYSIQQVNREETYSLRPMSLTHGASLGYGAQEVKAGAGTGRVKRHVLLGAYWGGDEEYRV